MAEAKRDDRGIATVRVQAERLDELMDRVGELVIAQAQAELRSPPSGPISRSR